MELTVVPITKPDAANFIFGQSHFIKTVEDLHEAFIAEVACRTAIAAQLPSIHMRQERDFWVGRQGRPNHRQRQQAPAETKRSQNR